MGGWSAIYHNARAVWLLPKLTNIARAIAETHRVYALDLRNHGASPLPPSMTYQEMAQDVAEFMSTREIQTP